MNRLRRAVLLVLLALWMPATMHCLLETVPGLTFLRCCQHAGSAPHQDSDCQQDGCEVVESGAYRIEDNPSFEVPSFVIFELVRSDCVTPEVPAGPALPSFAPSPPEISGAWQFFFRTALPPRAPSFSA